MSRGFDDSTEAGSTKNNDRSLWLHSIGMMVKKSYLREEKGGDFKVIWKRTLRQYLSGPNRYEVSDKFKYLDQLNPGSATFFVVGSNLMMGAGHSLWDDSTTTSNLAEWYIVFDWWAQKEGDAWVSPRTIPRNNIYEIVSIKLLTLPTEMKLAKVYGRADFAVIELERDVDASRPSFVFTDKLPAKHSRCWAAGYPFGLPLKVSPGTIVDAPDSPVGGTEAFDYTHTMVLRAGNSGSPVLNDKNEVIAICTSGWDDYRYSDGLQMVVPLNRIDGKKLDTLMRTDGIRWSIRSYCALRIDIRFEGAAATTSIPVPFPIAKECRLGSNWSKNTLSMYPVLLPLTLCYTNGLSTSES